MWSEKATHGGYVSSGGCYLLVWIISWSSFIQFISYLICFISKSECRVKDSLYRKESVKMFLLEKDVETSDARAGV